MIQNEEIRSLNSGFLSRLMISKLADKTDNWNAVPVPTPVTSSQGLNDAERRRKLQHLTATVTLLYALTL